MTVIDYAFYLEQHPNVSTTELAVLISEECNSTLKLNSIKRALRKHKAKINKSKIVDYSDFGYKYDPESDMAVISGRSFEGGRIDNLIHKYTSCGYTQAELAYELDFSVEEISKIFKTLGITKKSPNRAPWLINMISPEKLSKDTFKKNMDAYKKTHEKSEMRRLRRHVSRQVSEDERKAKIMKGLVDHIKSIPYVPTLLPKGLLNYDNPRKVISPISDWHIGAKGRNNVRGKPYNVKLLAQRLESFRDGVVRYRRGFRGEVVETVGFLLGDILDDPLSQTFPGQSGEQELTGVNQFMFGYRVLIEHILFHHQVFGGAQRWFAVAGNHGYDFEDVLYNCLKRELENFHNIDISITPTEKKYIEVYDEWSDTHIVALHGDGGRVDAKRVFSMMSGGSKNKLLIHGHKHHLEVVEEARGSLRIMVPSIMGGNAYAQGYGMDSSPAQMLIELYKNNINPVYMRLD